MKMNKSSKKSRKSQIDSSIHEYKETSKKASEEALERRQIEEKIKKCVQDHNAQMDKIFRTLEEIQRMDVSEQTKKLDILLRDLKTSKYKLQGT